ncbi:hypothetical protein ACPV3A_32750 [Paenibacillus sp. Dod16]|uniref:hypothetical protein n=1 Tax=Paenibacillus sp. Dod16 TaxID=3416392 RepID=UPI003CF75B91
MEKKYHALHEDKIYMGGAADVEEMVKQEGVQVVVEPSRRSHGVRINRCQSEMD